MKTEKLYLKDIKSAYKTKFNARIQSVEDNKIILDRTLFYPLGGGQNWDLGHFQGPNGNIQVMEVRGRDYIEHYVETDHQLSSGDEIIGVIDWDRRYSHMRMHTAQHLMSGIVYEKYNGARTVGNQIHATHSRIDFNPISFNEEMLDELTNSVNILTNQNIIVNDGIMTRSQINSIMPPDRTNMNLLPKSVKNLRVVKIGDNIDFEGAADFRGADPRRAVAHPCAIDDFVRVLARARQGDFEGAGHGRFGPTGSGRAVFQRIPPHYTPRGDRVGAGREKGGYHDEQTGKTRRQNIERIIKLCRREAESGVAGILVADHGVHGVHGLIYA